MIVLLTGITIGWTAGVAPSRRLLLFQGCNIVSSKWLVPDRRERRKLQIDQIYSLDGAPTQREGLKWMDALDAERLAPLTKEVQRWIWERQNPDPATCSQRKFLVAGHLLKFDHGLGSLVHIMSMAMGVALDEGYIFDWASHVGFLFVDAGCGPNQNLDCIFARPTICSGETRNPGNTVTIVNLGPKTLNGSNFVGWQRDRVPAYWVDRLKATYPDAQFTREGIVAWWRAQTSAYLCRFRRETAAQVASLRLNASINRYLPPEPRVAKPPAQAPYPLPVGTISVQVRHGDKGSEMRLHRFRDYIQRAERHVNQNPLQLQKTLFLTTDDPDVVGEAHKLTHINEEASPQVNWAIIYSDIKRTHTPYAALFAAAGAQQATYTWLLQLSMMLECDVWVGTRGSNWDRLVDELRCTWVDKCSSSQLDVGDPKDWDYRQRSWRRRLQL